MLTIRAMSDGKGYSSRHLGHNDYYAEGERVVGHWQGRGADLLGLSGGVKSEEFEAVRQGLDPQTSEFLRLRHSADRLAADGTKLAQGRSLYDFTFSAPKSVSVMASVGGDERLAAAHNTAVGEALREMERRAASRVRQDGANEDRTTGNLVLAVYHHDTSRELDPQLHTHAVAANLTYDGVEGRWKALQASEIYERRAYLTEVYRNALAREVRSLGYEIENRRDGGFEITGVSPDLLVRFSQRSQQRDAAVAEFTESHGRPPTDNEVAVLVRESRADKLTSISTADVRARQLDRVPADFHQFAHGYAVTAHRSQGKSVDAVIISADGMQKELFYVAASRGRQSIQVVTSDKERLQQTVGRSTARKSASELWRSAAGRCSPRGAGRGIAAAREMVRRTARFVASIQQRITERNQEPRKERTHERGFGR